MGRIWPVLSIYSEASKGKRGPQTILGVPVQVEASDSATRPLELGQHLSNAGLVQ